MGKLTENSASFIEYEADSDVAEYVNIVTRVPDEILGFKYLMYDYDFEEGA